MTSHAYEDYNWIFRAIDISTSFGNSNPQKRKTALETGKSLANIWAMQVDLLHVLCQHCSLLSINNCSSLTLFFLFAGMPWHHSKRQWNRVLRGVSPDCGRMVPQTGESHPWKVSPPKHPTLLRTIPATFATTIIYMPRSQLRYSTLPPLIPVH